MNGANPSRIKRMLKNDFGNEWKTKSVGQYILLFYYLVCHSGSPKVIRPC